MAYDLCKAHCNKNPPDLDLCTPFYMASAYKRFDMMQFLLDQGVCVNAKDIKGYTPLFKAMVNKSQHVFEWLCKYATKAVP